VVTVQKEGPHSYACCPLSTETFEPAMELLNTLVETTVDGGVIKESFVATALQKMSVGVCRFRCP
jgi:hypothetical protein